MATKVAASMPPITPVPIEWRLAEPAPWLMRAAARPARRQGGHDDRPKRRRAASIAAS